MAGMLGALDTLTPLVWAAASAAVLGLTWLLRKAGGAAMDERIDHKLDLLYKRLDEHLISEESVSNEINRKLAGLEVTFGRARDREDDSHRRIWEAIEQLRREAGIPGR